MEGSAPVLPTDHALAIARAALREPDLPTATLHGQFREIRLLVDHREDLVAARTQMQNRLRWHLHALEPGTGPRPWTATANSTRLTAWLADRAVARLAGELVADIRTHTVRIDQLKQELARWSLRWPRRCWRCPAADRSSPRRSSASAGQPVPLRGLLRAPHRHRTDPRLVGKHGTGSPAAATDNSTPHCTGSR